MTVSLKKLWNDYGIGAIFVLLILAYLEAKNIKKTYMLDNLNDSDSEFDAEIDEVSESELENF